MRIICLEEPGHGGIWTWNRLWLNCNVFTPKLYFIQQKATQRSEIWNDKSKLRTYLLIQSSARIKKSLCNWCSSLKIEHCSSVTDIDVLSLALLQQVNRIPLSLRQIYDRQKPSNLVHPYSNGIFGEYFRFASFFFLLQLIECYYCISAT